MACLVFLGEEGTKDFDPLLHIAGGQQNIGNPEVPGFKFLPDDRHPADQPLIEDVCGRMALRQGLFDQPFNRGNLHVAQGVVEFLGLQHDAFS